MRTCESARAGRQAIRANRHATINLRELGQGIRPPGMLLIRIRTLSRPVSCLLCVFLGGGSNEAHPKSAGTRSSRALQVNKNSAAESPNRCEAQEYNRQGI